MGKDKKDKKDKKGKVKGNLQVRVIQAQQLMAADKSLLGKGSSDPYVIVRLSSKSQKNLVHKTNVIRKNLNPVWNKDFQFQKVSPTDKLAFEVIDEDVGKDDCIGIVGIDLAFIADQQPKDIWLPLKGKNGQTGKYGNLNVMLQWTCSQAGYAAAAPTGNQPMQFQATVGGFAQQQPGMQQQYPHQGGVVPAMQQHYGMQPGIQQQYPQQPGMQQQYPQQPGMQHFPPQQSGMQQQNPQPGMQQYPQQPGMQQYPQQPGMQQYPQQPGMQQYPQQPGMQQYPQQPGMQQYPQQPGGYRQQPH